ncbi:phosphoglycerate kinase [Candidatus Pacearchaeota archaeon CG_4_10_14_0_2_um_filter_05_32_18]|nr:MAG: phosphoglycerate kinase [Candidatus Pacearchaeota archaeon CG_4_10_14_0_2_um_filter_05_32_18]
MDFQTIKKLDLKGKVVILRVDINSEIIGGKLQNNPRFEAHSKTIKFLKSKKAKIVILAHQGSPGENDFISLEQHAKILSKYTKVKFVKDIIGKQALNEIGKLKNGEALLLENVRFLKEEFDTSDTNRLVKALSMKSDYYVNDAFSVSHRNQASIVSFPKVLPSFIGLTMESELENISRLKEKSKNALFIFGGKKTKDLLPFLNNRKILSTGTLSLLCLLAKSYNLGKEKDMLKNDLKFIDEIKPYLKNIITPVDFAVSVNGKRKNIGINDLPSKYPIYDIGDKTIELYKKEIKNAEIIFFKGAVGKIEEKNFQKGTRELLKEIARNKSHVFSVISGGSSALAINKFKISKNSYSYISLSGGALVHYLAGENLPGLEALKDKR